MMTATEAVMVTTRSRILTEVLRSKSTKVSDGKHRA